MNGLSAFIIKINRVDEIEEMAIELAVSELLNNDFEEFEVANMILDEENRTMISFISENSKYKLDRLVEALKSINQNSIAQYENITKKILYENNFSDYQFESDKIKNYIRKNLSVNNVLDKISFIGMHRLTDIDRCILSS